MRTSFGTRSVAVVVAGLFCLTACGQSDAQDEAKELAADTEAVASGAADYVGDPWERRAREENLRKMQAPDGWQHLAIERHHEQNARRRAERCN